MDKQILIKTANSWFELTKSRTGQLDFAGRVAEPYNPHDQNASIVSIENPEAKICGNPGLEKAGHIRALAAKIIREAKPQKMAYGGKLCSLTCHTICVQVMV